MLSQTSVAAMFRSINKSHAQTLSQAFYNSSQDNSEDED